MNGMEENADYQHESSSLIPLHNPNPFHHSPRQSVNYAMEESAINATFDQQSTNIPQAPGDYHDFDEPKVYATLTTVKRIPEEASQIAPLLNASPEETSEGVPQDTEQPFFPRERAEDELTKPTLPVEVYAQRSYVDLAEVRAPPHVQPQKGRLASTEASQAPDALQKLLDGVQEIEQRGLVTLVMREKKNCNFEATKLKQKTGQLIEDYWTSIGEVLHTTTYTDLATTYTVKTFLKKLKQMDCKKVWEELKPLSDEVLRAIEKGEKDKKKKSNYARKFWKHRLGEHRDITAVEQHIKAVNTVVKLSEGARKKQVRSAEERAALNRKEKEIKAAFGIKIKREQTLEENRNAFPQSEEAKAVFERLLTASKNYQTCTAEAALGQEKRKGKQKCEDKDKIFLGSAEESLLWLTKVNNLLRDAVNLSAGNAEQSAKRALNGEVPKTQEASPVNIRDVAVPVNVCYEQPEAPLIIRALRHLASLPNELVIKMAGMSNIQCLNLLNDFTGNISCIASNMEKYLSRNKEPAPFDLSAVVQEFRQFEFHSRYANDNFYGWCAPSQEEFPPPEEEGPPLPVLNDNSIDKNAADQESRATPEGFPEDFLEKHTALDGITTTLGPGAGIPAHQVGLGVYGTTLAQETLEAEHLYDDPQNDPFKVSDCTAPAVPFAEALMDPTVALTTEPSTKLIINAPFDSDYPYRIKIMNNSARQIAWTMHKFLMNRLECNVTSGLLDPSGCEVVDDIMFSALPGEDLSARDDYIYIDWINTPDGATQPIQLQWFHGSAAFKTILPIEYNL